MIYRALLFLISVNVFAQPTSSNIFAHNDYEKKEPFTKAFGLHVGYIEADIFLKDGALLVAHTAAEISKTKTLENLYLQPLQKQLSGSGYSESSPLALMIDLKTAGKETLGALVQLMASYPDLANSKSLRITISGNMPDASTWSDYPNYIFFDGRPGNSYTAAQLQRINLVSASFRDYTQWNGKGELTSADRKQLLAVIQKVHAWGKPIRFWAIPDFTNAWIKLNKLGVDILNTDEVEQLHAFLAKWSSSTYQNKTPHATYQPIGQWKEGQRPKNLIIMIGDGAGLAQFYSGYTANRGKLNVFQIPMVGFSITNSSDSYITDSAAGATAIAAGTKTKNRFIGVDSTGKRLPLLTYKLKKKKYQTAIISNGDITDATPASFYAFQPERIMSEEIALDFIQSDVDLLMGGGLKSFQQRKDGKKLFDVLRQKGYQTTSNFGTIDTLTSMKFVVLDDSAVIAKKKGRGDFLIRSLNKSLDVFTKSNSPFFIMLESAQIDWGGHNNDLEYVVTEVLDFDQTIGEALKFADQNKETLILITADHETGGLSLIDGDIQTGYVHGSFSTNDHTGIMVPVFAYGPGAEVFKGIHQNTELYHLLMELFLIK
ncbi:MAG: alkaline phosphatase [Cyclobacteriaceae bacterium]|jgi:alkaline phosphatase